MLWVCTLSKAPMIRRNVLMPTKSCTSCHESFLHATTRTLSH